VSEKWDYDPKKNDHHHYKGVIDKVKEAFDKDVGEANDVWFKKLDEIVTTYASKPWSVAVRSRQGSLYDSCRSGLYNATLVNDTTHTGDVELYTDKEKQLLKQAEASQNDQLMDKADQIRTARREAWVNGRKQWLVGADKAMIRFYTEAVVWARAYKVRNDAVDRAIRRLAFFTDILGNEKMKDYSQGVVDPDTKQPFVYQDDSFLKSRPGLSPPLAPNGLPAPLPASQ